MTDVIRPQPGPQEAFLASPADIVIYGGSAGGGKSYGLLLEPLRHHENPGFGGVIFRRTSPQLVGAGSLWEHAEALYQRVGARTLSSPELHVEFASGASLQFLHLQYAKTVHDHQGKQYAFIGFDELTHFEPSQFWYMVSRMRSTCGVVPYMRCTTNPDPDSFVRDLIDWWIDADGLPIPERSGVLRYFTRIGGALFWADTRAECEDIIREHGLTPACDAADPSEADADVLSLTFIAASLDDNPALLAADPGYRARLMALPEVERARLLGGNWNVRPATGKYIKDGYFSRRWASERTLPPMFIYTASDYAVTPEEDEDTAPDWTEHGVFGVDANDDLYVLDWWSGQTQSDVWIERLLDKWARWKPQTAYGEAGVIRRAVEPFLNKRMRERRIYADCEWISAPTAERSATKQGYADPSKRAKARKARAFQARAAMGKIIFPSSAPWADRVIAQCIAFPQGPDDAFDVMALMCMAIDDAEGKPAGPQPNTEPPDRWAHAQQQPQRHNAWG